jgi:hypothetical protein
MAMASSSLAVPNAAAETIARIQALIDSKRKTSSMPPQNTDQNAEVKVA